MPVSNCSRYHTCVDCILARDPYCAWDFSTEQCSSVSSLTSSSNNSIQSLKEGDVTQCPQPGTFIFNAVFVCMQYRRFCIKQRPSSVIYYYLLCTSINLVYMYVFLDLVAAVDFNLVPQNNIQLPCQLHSNLAEVQWRFFDQTLHSDHKYYIYDGGLLILSASASDAGLYTCDSVEQINGRTYNRSVAVYRLQLDSGPTVWRSTTPGNVVTNSSDSVHSVSTSAPGTTPTIHIEDPLLPETRSDTGKITRLEVAVALLSLLCLSLVGVIFWIWIRGRLECFKVSQSSSEKESKRQSTEYMHIQNRTSEIKLPGPESVRPCSANNNHSAVDFKGNGEHHFTPMANISSLDGLGYINDESEI